MGPVKPPQNLQTWTHLSQLLSRQEQRFSLPGQQPMSRATKFQQRGKKAFGGGPAEAAVAWSSQHHSVQGQWLHLPNRPCCPTAEAVMLHETVAGEESQLAAGLILLSSGGWVNADQ